MFKEIVLNARIQARSTLLSGPSIRSRAYILGAFSVKWIDITSS